MLQKEVIAILMLIALIDAISTGNNLNNPLDSAQSILGEARRESAPLEIVKLMQSKIDENNRHYLRNGANILRQVVKALSGRMDSNKVLKEKLADFESNIARWDKVIDGDQPISGGYLNDFLRLVDTYNFTISEATSPPSVEDTLISSSLQENGIKQLTKAYHENISSLIEDVFRKSDDYVKTLNGDDLKRNEQFVAWFAEFKKLTTSREKFHHISKLVYANFAPVDEPDDLRF